MNVPDRIQGPPTKSGFYWLWHPDKPDGSSGGGGLHCIYNSKDHDGRLVAVGAYSSKPYPLHDTSAIEIAWHARLTPEILAEHRSSVGRRRG